MDFDTLFQRLYPQLFRYLVRLTGSGDTADDLAQESFVRLLGRTLAEDEARRWLFTVATNLARDRGRRISNRQRLLAGVTPEVHSPEAPDEAVLREESRASVRTALERLSERDRSMLLMREEGLRYGEIARAVGVAPGSVGTLLARAAKRFAAAYREGGDHDAS